LIQIGTFEVTLQYFAYFISISSLVFENDKWTYGGCFGHFNMYHDLNTSFDAFLVFYNNHILDEKIAPRNGRMQGEKITV